MENLFKTICDDFVEGQKSANRVNKNWYDTDHLKKVGEAFRESYTPEVHEEIQSIILSKTEKQMDYKKISNIVFDGIDHSDYPDFCDAYIASADYDGEPMTQEQIDEINADGDFVYEQLMKHLF